MRVREGEGAHIEAMEEGESPHGEVVHIRSRMDWY